MRTSDSIKIAFVGRSGSGKTTCGEIMRRIIKRRYPKYRTVGLNVARPLHWAQAYLYRTFGLKNTGQDGVLLQFLAQHFEHRLGPVFRTNSKKLEAENGRKLVVINTDCRNNAYHYLKKAGFIFIKVEARPEILVERLIARGDIHAANPGRAVEKTDLIKPDLGVENNGTLAELRQILEDVLVAHLGL